MSAQCFLATKTQNEHEDLVAGFLASGGEVTVGQPAHAKGNEAGRGTKWTVNDARKEFRKNQK